MASKAMRLYLGLLHYPVYNKNGRRIASAITSFDLHDLSRLAKTYGVKRFFVITPLTDQQELAERIVRHWTAGYGAGYNPDRKEALELVAVLPSLEDGLQEVERVEGERPVLMATDASRQNGCALTYPEATRMISSGKPVLLLLGTAWGLDKEVFQKADYILEPVRGLTEYNHLSVRSAGAIILDRLVGR
jgi:tRNA (guanine37-N1)-methyltransferase